MPPPRLLVSSLPILGIVAASPILGIVAASGILPTHPRHRRCLWYPPPLLLRHRARARVSAGAWQFQPVQ
eukprot:3758545-Rhodomonas_salina.1